MNYIIDPMWFYWIGVADVAKFIIVVVFVISSVVTIAASIFIATNFDEEYECDDFVIAKRILKVALPVCIVATAGMLFLPSKNTLIEMQIARYATQENAELTIDAIKSAVDYIVQAIKGA